jgi:hypothetical protein
MKEGRLRPSLFVVLFLNLERLDVGSLPALRAFDDIELHRLTLLEALETARSDH